MLDTSIRNRYQRDGIETALEIATVIKVKLRASQAEYTKKKLTEIKAEARKKLNSKERESRSGEKKIRKSSWKELRISSYYLESSGLI
jgi:hypothetical protein